MNRKPLIIAEIGNCHEGSLGTGITMIERAAACDVDLIKFQAGTAEGFSRADTDVERYRKYELGYNGYWALAGRCWELGVEPFFSVWNTSFECFMRHPIRYVKIPARQCTAEAVERLDGENTFISIPHWFEEKDVKALGIKLGTPMHCVTEYPAKDPMLVRITKLAEWTGRPAGYSDHTIGIDACIAAARGGAVAIEKHFTLGHDFGPLRDHILAATHDEMKELVNAIRG